MAQFLLVTIFFIGLCSVVPSSSVAAQTITVKNYVNPSAPLVRESLTVIEGENFTDEALAAETIQTTQLGGVEVFLNGVPQRLRTVSPNAIIFILDAAGAGTRALSVRTKSNGSRSTVITVVNAWPSIIVQSVADDDKAYLAFGFFILDPLVPAPLPITTAPLGVGQKRPTQVTVTGSGMRFASSIQVRLNGIPCQVVSVVPSSALPGLDDLTFTLPPLLANVGSVDLSISVGGRESNYARLLLGTPAN